jgi:hypothetical protein
MSRDLAAARRRELAREARADALAAEARAATGGGRSRVILAVADLLLVIGRRMRARQHSTLRAVGRAAAAHERSCDGYACHASVGCGR